jgi:hypothetical protein
LAPLYRKQNRKKTKSALEESMKTEEGFEGLEYHQGISIRWKRERKLEIHVPEP